MILSIAAIFIVYEHQRQINIFNLPLTDVLGAITLIIVLITLYSSVKAARESARANMLNYLPLLTLHYDHSQDRVIVENIGNGVATNIKVDSFYNWWADKNLKLYGLTKIVFKTIPILKHGEKRAPEKTVKGVVDPLQLTTFIMFSKHQKPLIFVIKFLDLTGKKYITKVRIYNNRVEIVLAPRPLTIINILRLFIMRVTEKCTMVWYSIKVVVQKHKDSKEQNELR